MISEISIIFGSQTGKSEEYARRIGRLLRINNIRAKLLAGDDIDDHDFMMKHQFVIFVLSTYGQGVEPDNFKKFWLNLLRAKLPVGKWLNQTYCAVLGLGDSSYKKFNFAAKKLYRRLMQLGCKTTIPLGLADEQDEFGSDTVSDAWINQLMYLISNMNNIPTPTLRCVPWQTRFTVLHTNHIDNLQPFSQYNKFYVVKNERITSSEHFQQVNCVEFKSQGQVRYSPGDVFTVMPRNDASMVISFMNLFSHITKDTLIRVISSDPNEKLPECLGLETTFEWLCYHYFDLNATPRQWFFELFCQYSKDKLEQDKLFEFSQRDMIEDYYSYCTRPRRNYYEVFRDFPNSLLNIRLEDLLELVPAVRPREYSICSSVKVSPESLSIIVANVYYQTNIRQARIGVCSNYLCSLSMDSHSFVYGRIRAGNFKFPSSPNLPFIMISTGTGCAPFHAYCLSLDDSPKNNPNLIFMGFRNYHRDYLLKDSWENIKNTKNVQVILAFSRDNPNIKVYVQDKLFEMGENVWELISNGACIYLSGNAKIMPNDVYECLENIISKFGNMNKTEASTYLVNMERQNKYQTETY